jgi:hypothetical protein
MVDLWSTKLDMNTETSTYSNFFPVNFRASFVPPAFEFPVLTVSRPHVSVFLNPSPRRFTGKGRQKWTAFHDTLWHEQGFFALHSKDDINEVRSVNRSSGTKGGTWIYPASFILWRDLGCPSKHV